MPTLADLATDADQQAFAARVASSSGDPIPVMLNDGFQSARDFYDYVLREPPASIDVGELADALRVAFPEGRTSPPDAGPISMAP